MILFDQIVSEDFEEIVAHFLVVWDLEVVLFVRALETRLEAVALDHAQISKHGDS